MWAILGILLIAIIILLIEVPPLLKAKRKKELWVFSILLLFATALSISKSLQVNIPNPLDWLTIIFKPFTDFIVHALQ
jgi:hypothetical protein